MDILIKHILAKLICEKLIINFTLLNDLIYALHLERNCPHKKRVGLARVADGAYVTNDLLPLPVLW